MTSSGASRKQGLVLVLLVLVIIAGSLVLLRLPRFDNNRADVYFSFVEGQRLLAHENPYARVLSSDMRRNDKYATYFPLFYLLSALTQKIGFDDYARWISFWRIIFLASTVGSACVIFWTLYQRQAVLAAVFAALFWLFNRWTLYNIQIGTPDFIAIFLLLLSLLVFDTHRIASLLLLSVSLAVKQIAILLVPLYLIWIWQATDKDRARAMLSGVFAMAVVPLIISLPFLFWNAEGFVKSIAFSLTRNASAHVDARSIESFLGLRGLPARLPMFLMFALVYLLAWRRTVGRYLASLLTMAVFIDFNAVLFLQYFGWLAPLIPLSIADFLDLRRRSVPAA